MDKTLSFFTCLFMLLDLTEQENNHDAKIDAQNVAEEVFEDDGCEGDAEGHFFLSLLAGFPTLDLEIKSLL